MQQFFSCVRGRAGRPARPRTQHGYHHDTKVKPEAATPVVELLMMGGRTPEICWALNKRQDNKLNNYFIWLVIYLNCTMMHGLRKLKKKKKKIKLYVKRLLPGQINSEYLVWRLRRSLTHILASKKCHIFKKRKTGCGPERHIYVFSLNKINPLWHYNNTFGVGMGGLHRVSQWAFSERGFFGLPPKSPNLSPMG